MAYRLWLDMQQARKMTFAISYMPYAISGKL